MISCSTSKGVSFNKILDWIIGSNLFGDQAEPSAIALGSRLIIEANGFAHALDQGVKQNPLAAVVGHWVVRERYATRSRPHPKAGPLLLDCPRRREAALRHSQYNRTSRRLVTPPASHRSRGGADPPQIINMLR